jgi:hypothetical protein
MRKANSLKPRMLHAAGTISYLKLYGWIFIYFLQIARLWMVFAFPDEF